MGTEQLDLIFKFLGIIVLVVVIVFVATWGGLIKCNSVPYLCDAYDFVLGAPRVAIVYGDAGLGDPEKLKEILLAPDSINAKAVDLIHLDRISLGNLKNYKLVIVEKARVLSFDQLEMFKMYVDGGGRLVWVGDSGVEKTSEEGEKSYTDINELKAVSSNPWVRIKETDVDFKVLYFDEFLGLKYFNNYCDEVNCNSNLFTVGSLRTEPTGNHTLIYGLSSSLGLKISQDRDFAVVRQFPNSSNSNVVLTLDFGGNISGKTESIGKTVPLIVASGIGERIVYYAYPLEYFVSDNNYSHIVTRMYYGMLGR